MIKNATLIIRASGERTQELCKKLVLEQGVAEAQVFVVQEVPFSVAMRKSFEIGISEGRKWTFCVDADVLLRKGSINKMIEAFEQQQENVCELQGYVLDKFFGGPREAGFHLYRTSLLDKVIERIPNDHRIRPESATLMAMEEDGYPMARIPYLVGLHDFEQYNKDIFRKCFVQAHKHLSRAELFITVCKNRMQKDKDYSVGLDGFVAGVYHNGQVSIDSTQDIYINAYTKRNIIEKQELDINVYDFNKVEEIIKQWQEPTIFAKYLPFTVKILEANRSKTLSQPNRKTSYKSLITEKFIELGIIRIIPYAIGWILMRIGSKLTNLVSKS